MLSPGRALYVLDGLLENDTVLRPREHYTHTHGFTEQLFGRCRLLSFSFIPRLKDLKDQQLYRPDRESLGPADRAMVNEALRTWARWRGWPARGRCRLGRSGW